MIATCVPLGVPSNAGLVGGELPSCHLPIRTELCPGRIPSTRHESPSSSPFRSASILACTMPLSNSALQHQATAFEDAVETVAANIDILMVTAGLRRTGDFFVLNIQYFTLRDYLLSASYESRVSSDTGSTFVLANNVTRWRELGKQCMLAATIELLSCPVLFPEGADGPVPTIELALPLSFSSISDVHCFLYYTDILVHEVASCFSQRQCTLRLEGITPHLHTLAISNRDFADRTGSEAMQTGPQPRGRQVVVEVSKSEGWNCRATRAP